MVAERIEQGQRTFDNAFMDWSDSDNIARRADVVYALLGIQRRDRLGERGEYDLFVAAVYGAMADYHARRAERERLA